MSHTGSNNDPTVALPKEEMTKLRNMLNIDHDVSEFYIRGQAKLLEQAHNAARSKNLTELVTHRQLQNRSEDYSDQLEPQRYRDSGNNTWAP